MSLQGRVCVVGTMVMDMICYTDRRPGPGETVIGSSYEVVPGGKGFNQAVAAARAGAQVSMIGAVGRDPFGRTLIDRLRHEGVDASGVTEDDLMPTGAGFPQVVQGGGNSIVVIPGAGETLDQGTVREAAGRLRESDVVSLQLELPVSVALAVAKECRETTTLVLLNPAPAQGLSDELLSMVDVLVPNEVEVEQITGKLDPRLGAVDLAKENLGMKVAVTCGPAGVVAAHEDHAEWFPAPKVEAIDTVGAGDVFCGFLAAGLAAGDALPPRGRTERFGSVGVGHTNRRSAQLAHIHRARGRILLMTSVTHPQILRALAGAGHGASILIADGNYPSSIAVNDSADIVYLNLAPGVVGCAEVLKALAPLCPIEEATVMAPESGPEPDAWTQYRDSLPDLELVKVTRTEFYELCKAPQLALAIVTGELGLFANLLLRMGVYTKKGTG